MLVAKRKFSWMNVESYFKSNDFSKVQTYRQSGNVVLNHKSKDSIWSTHNLEQLIKKHYTFELPTLVLAPEQLKNPLKSNPFMTGSTIDDTQTYFTFLKDSPTQEGINAFEARSNPNEIFLLNNQVVYYVNTIGIEKAKFTNKTREKKLETCATNRTFNTALKLI
ncbi:MAG: hypothetical protein ACJA2N_001786 [Salibacteraceae bacterium]|jgi:uncharacterized protein (DUF1697 family)